VIFLFKKDLKEKTKIKFEIIRILVNHYYSIGEAKLWLRNHKAGIGEGTFYKYAENHVYPFIDRERVLLWTAVYMEHPQSYRLERLKGETEALRLLEIIKPSGKVEEVNGA
jgi:hypothetical protein